MLRKLIDFGVINRGRLCNKATIKRSSRGCLL